MPEFKGTPGPWMLSGKTVYAMNKDGFNRFSALVQDAHTKDDELLANAQLIAAAPDLLEALRDLEEAYCDAGPEMTAEKRKFGRAALIAARAALAKALGQ